MDVSLAVKWVVDEIGSELATLALSEPITVHAPEFLLVEAAAVLWKKRRNGSIGADDPSDMFEFIASARVIYHDNRPLVGRALEMALATGRTVYDCTYLALAERLKAPLVTADERFVNALAATPWHGTAVSLSAWGDEFERTGRSPR